MSRLIAHQLLGAQFQTLSAQSSALGANEQPGGRMDRSWESWGSIPSTGRRSEGTLGTRVRLGGAGEPVVATSVPWRPSPVQTPPAETPEESELLKNPLLLAQNRRNR